MNNTKTIEEIVDESLEGARDGSEVINSELVEKVLQAWINEEVTLYKRKSPSRTEPNHLTRAQVVEKSLKYWRENVDPAQRQGLELKMKRELEEQFDRDVIPFIEQEVERYLKECEMTPQAILRWSKFRGYPVQ